MKWSTQAPANIALIKYMGKRDTTNNIPCNASLSYALENCLSFVELETTEDQHDRWEPLHRPNTIPVELSSTAQQRFLKHVERLKHYFNYHGNFITRSANNFPAGCGIASSASSFAALTLCGVTALAELTQTQLPSLTDIAKLSQRGSGSSCRSIITPWALWTSNNITPVTPPLPALRHHVVIVNRQQKAITSSEAHQRIQTSLLFENRPKRAEKRLEQLLESLRNNDWQRAFILTWQEFWDMHALFTTSTPPFSYFTPDSIAVLNTLQDYWQKHGDGPLVTMDAGPNVHLLFRDDQKDHEKQITATLLSQYEIL